MSRKPQIGNGTSATTRIASRKRMPISTAPNMPPPPPGVQSADLRVSVPQQKGAGGGVSDITSTFNDAWMRLQQLNVETGIQALDLMVEAYSALISASSAKQRP